MLGKEQKIEKVKRKERDFKQRFLDFKKVNDKTSKLKKTKKIKDIGKNKKIPIFDGCILKCKKRREKDLIYGTKQLRKKYFINKPQLRQK